MADFTRPISERTQPDAYKLATRRESLYILIETDDNADSRVLPYYTPGNFFLFHHAHAPAHFFPPFRLFPTRETCIYLFATVNSSDACTWNNFIFRIENKEEICHFEEFCQSVDTDMYPQRKATRSLLIMKRILHFLTFFNSWQQSFLLSVTLLLSF